MRVLFIGSDSHALVRDSSVFKRMLFYSTAFERMALLVLSSKEEAKEKEKLLVKGTGGGKIRRLHRAYRQGMSLIKKEEITHVSTQDPFEIGLVGYFLAKKKGIPLQLQIHTDLFSSEFRRHSLKNKIRVRIARFLLPRANSIRVVSNRIKESIESEVKTDAPIYTLPVYWKSTGGEGTKEKIQGSLHIAMVGRLESEKDYTTALLAFKQASERVPDAKLSIAGSGSERKKLEVHAEALGISDSVSFVGGIDDVPAFLLQHSIFLHTARYEGYGLALIEAALAGCAIVSTDVGIIGEVLRDGKESLVCPVGDAECLGTALSILLLDREKREGLGIQARDRSAGCAQTNENFLQKIHASFLGN